MSQSSVRHFVITTTAAGCLLAGLAAAGPALAASHPASTAKPATTLPLSAAQLRADQRLHGLAAASGGSVTGLARAPGGAPLAGICVTAYGPNGQQASAVTRQAGRFVISGLRPGRYQVQYRGCDPAEPYLPEWYGDILERGQSSSVLVSGQQLQPLDAVTLYPASPADGQLTGIAADPRDAANQMAADPFGAHAAGPASPAALMRSLAARAGRLDSAVPAATAASRHGRISGRVTSPAGKGLAGICVEIVPAGSSDSFGFGSTGKSGGYNVGGLTAGRYDLLFLAQCGNNGNWLAQVYKGKSTLDNPTTVRVKAARTTAGVDAVMKLGGEISGTVTGPLGKKLYGICVSPLQTINPLSNSEPLPVFSAVSVNGRYHVRGVPSGSYQLGFAPCGDADYAPTLWPGTQNFTAAATIKLKPRQLVTNIDEVMQLGGIIKGTVTSAADPATKLSGQCVTVQQLDGLGDTGFATTSSAGDYVIKGLDAGSYQVSVMPGCGNNGNYVAANYPANVAVRNGETSAGIDVALPTGAVISGTVTSARTARPVAGICVDLATEGIDFAEVTSTADGTYSVNQLPAGTYQVQFSGGCGNTGSYAPQGYHGTSVLFPQDIHAATGADITGIDAAMQPGPVISGTITSSTGSKLTGMCAVAISPGGIEYAIAASSRGRYDLANLAPGQYQVGFGPGCGNNADLAVQWFRSQNSEDTAGLVSAPAGRVSGIDGVLPPAGGISGVLKAKSGRSLQGGCVLLTGLSGPARSTSAQVGVFGSQYEITGMPLGGYQIAFQPGCFGSGYATQWYNDKPSPAHATDVTIRAGQVDSHIDSAVVPGGKIAGQITSDGKPVHDMCVFAQNISQDAEYGDGVSNVQGDYIIRGLNSGRYELDLSPCGRAADALVSEIVPKLVRVSAPARTSNVNVAVPAGGTISGSVMGESPATAQPGVCVLAFQVGGENGTLANTAADGSYQLTNLPAGRYQLYFGDPGCGFGAVNLAAQWYPDTQSQVTAGSVTVTAGGTTDAGPTTLGTDGSIAGLVTGPGAKPLAGVCVAATAPGQVPVYAVTGSGGFYLTDDLQPGQYLVEFSSGCGSSGYKAQWWQGASARRNATMVDVTGGAATTGIGAAMRK